jgi:hypothetical protein
MADTIIQKRIYELAEFVPVVQGDPEWEDPSTLWVAIDKVTWAEPKRMSLIQFVADLHKEQGPVDISSVNVSETYDVAFISANYYLRIDAYRIVTISEVGDVMENIPIIDLNKTVNGFTLVLESYQAGDILTYLAFE